MALLFALLAYVVTVIRRIRIDWRWVWRIPFFLFLTFFLFIKFPSFGCNVTPIIRQIWFDQLWVWQWWVWLWVRWYVRFYFSLWLIRWLYWRLCWLCQWHGVWNFCTDRNRFNWWRFSICRVFTKISRIQRWLTHRNILAPKILIFLLFSKSVL